MFVLQRVVHALESHLDRFKAYQAGRHRQREEFQAALERICGMSRQELESLLSQFDAPGALPTMEQGEGALPHRRFGERWCNHQQARAWAMEILRGRPTFAVDGSHIPPLTAFSLPVAMIQIGWFENPHLPGCGYTKDIEVVVVPPDELLHPRDRDAAGRVDAETWISLRRYQRETEKVCEYLRSHAGAQNRPVVFFDGSLVASFAGNLARPLREAYIAATMNMLVASQDAGVPLVGYVDTSMAHDLVSMIALVLEFDSATMNDSSLVDSGMVWGDRSLAYICARDDDVLRDYRDPLTGEEMSRRIGFLYLKTTADNPPARIEFPLWILEDGLLEDTLNIVRAETIIGNGYPYPLETADAVSVLTLEDRERFHRAFQDFAVQHTLPLCFSRKALSKRRRRV